MGTKLKFIILFADLARTACAVPDSNAAYTQQDRPQYPGDKLKMVGGGDGVQYIRSKLLKI